jgi:hypothetical protein
VPLVDKAQGGELLGAHPRRAPQAVAGPRLPRAAVHIRDNLELRRTPIASTCSGVPVGEA